MNKILIVVAQFIAWASIPPSAAQNLAPNPSFEEYNNCITFTTPGLSYFGLPEPTVKEWALPTDGSTDYFNTCVDTAVDAVWWASVPTSGYGFQMPRTGNAYIGGIFAHFTPWLPDYREYLESRLLEPLSAGHRYFVSYWVNAPEDEAGGRLNIDQFGAYFSSTSYLDITSRTFLPFVPQVSSPVGQVFNDKENWEEVSGIFTASGGEEYITLGTFGPYDALTVDSSEFPSVLWEWGLYATAYYFIDDVCVLNLESEAQGHSFTRINVCVGDTIQIQGRPGFRYLWENSENTISRDVTAPGFYWVKSIDTAACSGYFIDSFEVVLGNPNAVLNIGNDTFLCDGSKIILDASLQGFTSYIWNTGDTTSAIEISELGQYYITAYDTACNSGADSINISAFSKPAIKDLNDTIICKGDVVQLRYSNTELVYHWSTGDVGCCIFAADSGIYTIDAIDRCGNRQTDTVHVNATNCNDCLLVPNAFSPNNDGLNDKFQPVARCLFSSYVLRIYNRWGQNVFTSYRPQDGWDGTFNAQPVDIGVYYYDVSAKPLIDASKEIYLKGDITLIQ